MNNINNLDGVFLQVELFNEILDNKTKNNTVRFELCEGNNISYGSGFFCKIFTRKLSKFPVLITCHHLIDEEYINNNETLSFSFFREDKNIKRTINLKNGRIIYQDKKLDVTFIQIKKEDNLYIHSFLKMDYFIDIKQYAQLKEKIYLYHYPKGEEIIHYSQGNIEILKGKNKYKAKYISYSGSSGAPIIDVRNNKVIGMHLGYYEKDEKRTIIILKSAIDKFNEEKSKEIQKALEDENLYF